MDFAMIENKKVGASVLTAWCGSSAYLTCQNNTLEWHFKILT
jgi:hypothetical protein